MEFSVSIQLISLTSREGLTRDKSKDFIIQVFQVSIQLISLTSRELNSFNLQAGECQKLGSPVSIQLISLTSREISGQDYGSISNRGWFPFN